MYRPKLFQENNFSLLKEIVEQFSFATVITGEGEQIIANHYPLLIEPRGESFVLTGHMAKANPQWKSFQSGKEMLVVFQGPHCYVSPSWYQPGPQVPTWNYAAVHVYGNPKLMSKPQTECLLVRMIQKYESRFEKPWVMDLPLDEKEGMLQAIVGFEISIERIEGKLKLSQNRTEEDRSGVRNALLQSADPMNVEVGKLMEKLHSNS